METIKPNQSIWKIKKIKDSNHKLKRVEIFLDETMLGWTEDPKIMEEIQLDLTAYAQIIETV